MTDQNSVVVIFVTAPDSRFADELARKLVGERLVACVNVVPGLRSHYWWEGEVQSSDEVLMVMKARKRDVPAVAERVASLHPYDIPEVIATEVVDGLEAYLSWVRSETERE
jgi:periplasmic divalent cation tolerance protein